jgi:glutathione synthase/RimK-type ligase-like ATP-grasp enzyme
MTVTPLEIEVRNGHPTAIHTIGLPTSTIKKYKIPLKSTAFLQLGSSKQPVKISKIKASHKLQLTNELATKLSLQSTMRLNLKYKPYTKTLSLGPLLGVFVSRYRAHKTDRPFSKTTTFCKEIAEACQLSGTSVFFFTPKDLKKSSSLLHGHAFYHGAWHSSTFPIPNVIYNRLTSRRYENLAHVQKFLHSIKQQHHTQVFNERYLNKSEVFRALRKETKLHMYLPESHLLTHPSLLKQMVSKYSMLFLKPITGSLGKGVIKIRRITSQQYECQTTYAEGIRKKRYASLQALTHSLSKLCKKRSYQIQQGIQLLTIDQRPLDFRALVQRNEQGKWTITSIVARIASPQHFVSNLARGGSQSTVISAITRSNLKGKASVISQKLKHASLSIAEGIEKQINSHFGELGVDLAVDKSGKVWLIEVNSKPSKDDQPNQQADAKIRPSVKNIVKYTKYLAGF